MITVTYRPHRYGRLSVAPFNGRSLPGDAALPRLAEDDAAEEEAAAGPGQAQVHLQQQDVVGRVALRGGHLVLELGGKLSNEAKSVAGNHWLRLSPSVALLRGQVWSSLGIRYQQQQLVD